MSLLESMRARAEDAGSGRGSHPDRPAAPRTTLDFARAYRARGWFVVAIAFREKGPKIPDWQNLRLTPQDVEVAFSGQRNVGVLLGEPSDWLVDVDLDCPEAVAVAPYFLVPTLTFGRSSARKAHWLYRAVDAEYAVHKLGREVLVELRSGVGKQTVFPGSTHKDTGETIEFDGSGRPDDPVTQIPAADLALAVARIAAAARLMRAGVLESDAVSRARNGETGEKAETNEPVPPAQPPGFTEFDRAVAKFNAEHPLDFSDEGRECPACGHKGCFGPLKKRLDRWSCFSASHEGVGLRGNGVWHGDALDLAADAANKTRADVLRDGGYFAHSNDATNNVLAVLGVRARTEPQAGPPTLTDAGNAERFAIQHRNKVRYCPNWNIWLVWDGSRWAPDQRNSILPLAIETARALADEARKLDDQGRSQTIKWSIRSESRVALENTVRLAQAEGALVVVPDNLDHDPWLLNLENGTLDLRTFELRAHDPSDLLTKLAPVRFDRSATCPLWDRLLERSLGGDTELIAFLQRALGYSLTGSTRDHALFFLYGSGANGKTTILETFQNLLGDYAKQAAPDLLVAQDHGSRHLTEQAALQGARFVVCSEVDPGRRLAEAAVKRLTGGERITANRMHRDHFTFTPTHKLFLAANDRPRISGTDEGIWRRIKQIPFMHPVPEHEQDKELGAKLLEELPGIFQWALAGCRDWQAGGLRAATAVTEATRAYRAEQDQFADFLSDCCETPSASSVPVGTLSEAYRGWCLRNGEKPLTPAALNKRLNDAGVVQGRSKTERFWKNIGLRGNG